MFTRIKKFIHDRNKKIAVHMFTNEFHITEIYNYEIINLGRNFFKIYVPNTDFIMYFTHGVFGPKADGL